MAPAATGISTLTGAAVGIAVLIVVDPVSIGTTALVIGSTAVGLVAALLMRHTILGSDDDV